VRTLKIAGYSNDLTSPGHSTTFISQLDKPKSKLCIHNESNKEVCQCNDMLRFVSLSNERDWASYKARHN